MYEEEDGWSTGDTLATLALLLGGGAAGYKLAQPGSKKALAKLSRKIKNAGKGTPAPPKRPTLDEVLRQRAGYQPRNVQPADLETMWDAPMRFPGRAGTKLNPDYAFNSTGLGFTGEARPFKNRSLNAVMPGLYRRDDKSMAAKRSLLDYDNLGVNFHLGNFADPMPAKSFKNPSYVVNPL